MGTKCIRTDWGIRLVGIAAMAVGAYWLGAWFTGAAARWALTGITMKTNMALSLALAGLSLLLLGEERAKPGYRVVGAIAAAVIIVIGALTLAEHLFEVDFGIDQLLAPEPPGSPATVSPGRMGPPGALSLFLLGAGLLAIALRQRRLSPYFGAAIVAINAIPALGFLYGINSFYSLPLTGIAWQTVLVLSALGAGLIMAHRDGGLVGMLRRPDAGGELFRRLLPSTLLILLIAGFLRAKGQHLGMYGTETGTGIFIIVVSILFTGLLWFSAGRLSRTAQAQRQSEEMLERAQQIAHLGSWKWDIPTGKLFWSDEIYRMFQISPNDFQPSHEYFLSTVLPEDREHVESAIADALAGPGLYRCEYRIRRVDGSVRHLFTQGHVDFDPERKPSLMFGAALDITDRKQADEALRESEEKARAHAAQLQATLDAAPAIIWTAHDAQCRVITGNRAAYQFLRVPEPVNLSNTGPAPETLVHYRIFQDGVELPPEEMPIQRVAASGQPLLDYPVEFRFDDGTVRMLLGNVIPLLGARGEPAGAIAAFMDITALKAAEQDLKRLIDDLARSNRDLKEFAYVASHDLQEPLRQVTAFVDLLQNRFPACFQGAAAEYMGFIVEGAARMRNLINDLLAYTRLDSAGRQLRPIRVQDVIEQALDNLRLSIQENSAEVTWSDLPTVIADRVQLVQVFQNLVGNSIKFRGKERPAIRIDAHRNEREWLFSVTDNSIGFPQDQAEKIFHLFQRLHSRDAYTGTGIGLAICKNIVERHGGRISAQSQPGKGATFYFTIPATNEVP